MRSSYTEEMAQLTAAYERVLAAVADALEAERPLRDDWAQTLRDVAYSIDRVVRRNGHPDDALHARAAMHCLLGLWMSYEEAEQIWLGEDPVVDTTGDSE